MISKLKNLIFNHKNISKLDYIYFDFKKYVCNMKNENNILINDNDINDEITEVRIHLLKLRQKIKEKTSN